MLGKILQRGGNSDQAEMSFIDHLEALRGHILRSAIVIVVLAVFLWFNIQWVFDNIILGPLNPNFITYTGLCKLSHNLHLGDALCLPPMKVEMQTNTFGSQFMTSFTIAFVGAFIAAFPYIFWEFWRFLKPALKENELKSTRFAIFWVSLFFLIGIAFGYFLLSPFTFNFLNNFQISNIGLITTRPTLDDYISNIVDMLIGCGVAFEMPVLTYVLTRVGIVTPKLLTDNRKYAVVIILVVAAVITPSPDWTSQMLVFVPLMGLFEISVGVSKRVYKEIKEEDERKEWS